MYHVHKLNVYVNKTWFLYIHVDKHVFERHGEHITNEIVIKLVSLLHMEDFEPESIDKSGFRYFVNKELELHNKLYCLVWLLPIDNSYIGVRTAFRR